jgi:hypothetical protein
LSAYITVGLASAVIAFTSTGACGIPCGALLPHPASEQPAAKARQAATTGRN